MARKPKLTVVGGPDSAGSAPKDHNSKINDDQLQALTRQLGDKRRRLVEAEKAAKAARMNHDKVIKAELGEHGLADIKLLDELSTPEGEKAFKEDMERQARVARWAGLTIGTQGNLFDEDRRPIVEKAFDDGKRAGLSGENAKPPHAPGTDAHDAWMKGWHEGQSVLMSNIKAPPPAAEIIKNPNATAPAGPDEFDTAGGD